MNIKYAHIARCEKFGVLLTPSRLTKFVLATMADGGKTNNTGISKW